MFPVRLSIKEHHPDGWFWKTLCVVYDNEALGILERLLTGFEFKIESVNSTITARQKDGSVTTL